MDPALTDWDWTRAEPVRRVVAALERVRFVGGCVRDALAGRRLRDIDLATPLLPETVMERLAAAGIKAIPTGLAHGTVTAVSLGVTLEITTLRRDLACDGRHAEVDFTEDWVADAARRDFTFNALSLDPDGTLYDPFGGVEDLWAGRVRFVGAAADRIREDVLRLLRWFRFQAHYGRTPPDAEALAACRALAPLLPGLSGERVRAELLRLLEADGCAGIWWLMLETGVVAYLVPEALRVERLAALVALEGVLGWGGSERALVRLAALLEGERAALEGRAVALRLSRAERERLLRLTLPPPRLLPAASTPELAQELVRLCDAGLFIDRLLLAMAGQGEGQGVAALAPARALAARWQAQPFPLSGADLMAQGVAPGPGLGRLLGELRHWWAGQGFLPDRAACLAELAARHSAAQRGGDR